MRCATVWSEPLRFWSEIVGGARRTMERSESGRHAGMDGMGERMGYVLSVWMRSPPHGRDVCAKCRPRAVFIVVEWSLAPIKASAVSHQRQNRQRVNLELNLNIEKFSNFKLKFNGRWDLRVIPFFCLLSFVFCFFLFLLVKVISSFCLSFYFVILPGHFSLIFLWILKVFVIIYLFLCLFFCVFPFFLFFSFVSTGGSGAREKFCLSSN